MKICNLAAVTAIVVCMSAGSALAQSTVNPDGTTTTMAPMAAAAPVEPEDDGMDLGWLGLIGLAGLLGLRRKSDTAQRTGTSPNLGR